MNNGFVSTKFRPTVLGRQRPAAPPIPKQRRTPPAPAPVEAAPEPTPAPASRPPRRRRRSEPK